MNLWMSRVPPGFSETPPKLVTITGGNVADTKETQHMRPWRNISTWTKAKKMLAVPAFNLIPPKPSHMLSSELVAKARLRWYIPQQYTLTGTCAATRMPTSIMQTCHGNQVASNFSVRASQLGCFPIFLTREYSFKMAAFKKMRASLGVLR